jgi:hypothetical protein
MGWLEKAKAALGLGEGAPPERPQSKSKDGRPPLRDLAPAPPSASLEDALAAREEGRSEEARAILRTIDRGKGLRTVLRAAAALEAGDQVEVKALLPAVASSAPPWMLALQIAAALGARDESRGRLVAFARGQKAPPWAIAWVAATSDTDEERRRGMVDLLFLDSALARTVAARDWKLEGAADDRAAVERYATFAHGRDMVRRFGATHVATVFACARREAG